MAAGNKDQILAIDVGTQSARALIFDLAGELLHKVQVPFEPYLSEHPGWAEQPPDFFWEHLCSACQQLWELDGVRKDAVAGVALTTQRATVVNVDAQGRPLRPAIIWLDQRRTQGLSPVGGGWGLLLKLSGMSGTVAHLQAEAEANWIRQHQPEIWEQTHKYLYLSGYLTFRLTGRYADSVGCQVGYMPFDYKKLKWSKPGGLNDRIVYIERDKLAELVPPGEVLGEIDAAAAEQTGIPAGLPMIAAAADKACEVLGAGCLEPDVACLSYGTTATVNTTSQRYVEAIPLLPSYPAAAPGAHNLEVQIFRGYWMVSWFKQEFGLREAQLAEQRGCTPEALFDELIEDVPPGAMGLTLLPFWSPGVKVPGPEAKGAIIGFGDVHKRAHVYRAILEGLAYALRQGLERTEKRLKTPAREVRVSGGGSQSDAAMQITADIFARPASRPHVYETSGLGAAMDAAVGLGLHQDFDAAIEQMTRISRTFQPRPEACEIYEQLYRRVFCRMYKQLRPLYAEIRSITGYPP
jgi:sugar (pentulose or hexulose) kinase